MPQKVILGTPEVKKSKVTNKKTLFEEKKGARFFSTFIQSGTVKVGGHQLKASALGTFPRLSKATGLRIKIRSILSRSVIPVQELSKLSEFEQIIFPKTKYGRGTPGSNKDGASSDSHGAFALDFGFPTPGRWYL